MQNETFEDDPGWRHLSVPDDCLCLAWRLGSSASSREVHPELSAGNAMISLSSQPHFPRRDHMLPNRCLRTACGGLHKVRKQSDQGCTLVLRLVYSVVSGLSIASYARVHGCLVSSKAATVSCSDPTHRYTCCCSCSDYLGRSGRSCMLAQVRMVPVARRVFSPHSA